MQIHLKSYYYNGGGDGKFQLKAKHSFTLDPSAGFFLNSAGWTNFSADIWISRIFWGNYTIWLKIQLNIINLTDNKPDIQNISITTKKFKVYKQC